MKKVLNMLIIFIVFGFIFYILNCLVRPKYVVDLIEGSLTHSYYNSSFDHDVIFLGDCEMYANFSPMVIYEETGIKSFVRANSQQLVWQSYYLLKETFKYETPDFIVFNVNSLRYNRKDKTNESYNRLMIDQMKWSKDKVDLINVSMDDNESFLSYVFPILRYHSRIDKLTKEDIRYLLKKESKSFNGFIVNKEIVPLENLPEVRPLINYEFSTENLEYLDKIVKLCKENNVKLILVKGPGLYPYWYEEYNNFFIDYAKNNKLDYYNLIDLVETIGIDYSTDTYDGGLHLNLNGATKLSKYFGDLLIKNYQIDVDRNDYFDSLLSNYNNYIGM